MINNNWIFGRNARLDFNSGSPVPVASVINTFEGCASISRSDGTLLFYTDGVTVWNSANVQVATNLGGHSSSTSSAIIVPMPGVALNYYIFCVDTVVLTGVGTDGLSYRTVDCSTGSVVVSATNIPLATPTAEKVCAVIKKNCKDYWLISCGRGTASIPNNDFYVYDINSLGISPIATQNTGPTNIGVYGYLKVSPSGRFLALASSENVGDGFVEVYSFDINTGIITHLKTIAPKRNLVYGVEFSENELFLYFNCQDLPATGTANAKEVYQHNLVSNTTTLIYTSPNIPLNPPNNSFANLGSMQMGPDGIIYIAKGRTHFLDAILSPDLPSPSCNYTPDRVNLGNPDSFYGLPTLVQTRDCKECECVCTGCNKDAEEQNDELIDRAKTKFNTIKSRNTCPNPFTEGCENSAINSQANLEPCFYFHWGDGVGDQIEEHDTEVFHITVCNPFNDIQYNGFRITKVFLIPGTHPIDKIQIVPDRFISLDCIKPCTCQTREFAMITRANDTAGNYVMEVEYCYESITFASGGNEGTAQFDLEITED